MNKKRKALMSLALATCMLTAPLASCGDSEIEFKEDTLYVASINKGFGLDWLYGLLDAYCAQNPGLKYEVTPAYSDTEIKKKVEAGEGYCNYDLIFTGAVNPAETRFLANLQDIYEYEYESGSRKGMTVAESMEKNILKSMTQRLDDSNYTCMPWTASLSALLINYTKLNSVLGEGWEQTYKLRTSDELIEFAEVLAGKDLSLFVHCADTSQYGNLYKAWFAQYNGVEGVGDYFNGRYINELGEEGIGPEVCKNQGVLEALKAGDAIFGAGYSYSKSNGITWEASQSFFMSGKSGLFHNGDWFAREMGTQYPNVDLRIMKTPVISALGTKLGITEEQLIELIDYVDAVNEGKTPNKPTITSKDYSADELIEKVAEARSWVASMADFFTAAVVDYNKKDLAKDFLKFMVSDKGQEAYVESSKGLTMAYGYNLEEYDGYENLSNFAKSRWKMTKNATYYMQDRTTKYGIAGLEPFKATTSYAPLGVVLSKKLKTVDEIYETEYTYNSELWSIYEKYN